MLHIFNSLTGSAEPFVPMEPGRVRMYVCGMTVYDYCHVGHARVWIVFDVVYRYLKYQGFDVTYVRNITDIEDKIIRRARENNEDFRMLTARFIAAMNDDTRALGILDPTLEPRATDHMEGIVDMVQALLDKGYAYQADNGDVYYDVSRFPAYGSLSNKKLDDLRVGARVDVDEAKDDPLDFVLWKAAKEGEPAWPSPWGPGRPGWHIECSVMSRSCLGDHFDIHGGGMDLKFPHHENEIAQSEAANDSKFVNYWMHNGFVQVDDEKMSKSLGNFFTVRDVLQQYQPEVVRLFILSSHYRSPLNYSTENLEHAKASLGRLYNALLDLPDAEPLQVSSHRQRFERAMDDDFNTPETLAALFDLARETNRMRSVDHEQAARLGATLRQLGAILGVLQEDPDAARKGTPRSAATGLRDNMAESERDRSRQQVALASDEIDDLIARRAAARNANDWSEADRIRDLLQSQGVVLEDGPNGRTKWRRA